jgi:hypothetical protein
MSLAKTAPSPRSTVRRPNYPVVLAASALLVLAACGGKVEGDGSDGEAAGSAGQGPMPMPTGAGSGGSYDPGTGGTVDTGGTGGYSGMPTGAGAGGSYETGGSGGQDFDAGMPSGASDGGGFEPDAGWEGEPCVSSCINEHPEGWSEMLEITRPCVCEPGQCGQICANTLCSEEPAQGVDATCGACVLESAQSTCTGWPTQCFQQTNCTAVVTCFLACQ